MGSTSAIEWTEATWNPVTGCTKVSPGCAHCYAEALTLRFHMGGRYLPGEAVIQTRPERLSLPTKWREPRMIFVNSMADLFHQEVPTEFIQQVFDVMAANPRHTFQVLTKRHERLAELSESLPFPSNVWVGVSVENQVWAKRRIPALRQVPAAVRFLSCEPLLGPLDLTGLLDGVHWVIAGGESGARARKANPDWVRDLRDACSAGQVPFFFKQWGGRTSKAGGRELDGLYWSEMPVERAVSVS